MTRGRVWLLLLATLSACAAAPPAAEPLFHANWYLQQDAAASASAPPTLFIAILNRSDRAQTVQSVTVNSLGPQGGDGWQWSSPGGALRLAPGQLLVQALHQFKRVGADPDWPACQLPVHVSITLVAGDVQRLRPVGLLPSALPQGWEQCPQDSAVPSGR